MNKYGMYRIYQVKETGELIQVPHDDVDDTLQKYAEKSLTLIEMEDDRREIDKMPIVQPWQ